MTTERIWSQEAQHLVQHFITGSTSERNSTYTKLMPVFNNYIDMCSRGYYKQPTEDLIQFVHARLYSYTLDKIDLQRKEKAKDLIYISIKHMIAQHLRTEYNENSPLQPLEPTEERNYSALQPREDRYEFIVNQDQQEARKQIIIELDRKVNELKGAKKKSQSLILMLLLIKQYLIDNEYDERECGQYLMQVMKLGRRTLITMFQRVGIKSFLFFRKK